MKHCFFAVDLGATSGRTILGTFTPQGLELQDVNRFPNHLIEVGGHYYWDIYEWIASTLQRMTESARTGFYNDLNSYINDINTAENVKVLWSRLHNK